MSRPISALKRDTRGEALVGFALVLPMLVLLSIGTLEFMLSVFDYHRAGDATRRGARVAAIAAPMVSQDALLAGGAITCTSTGTAVSCGGVSASAPESFAAIVSDMQIIQPAVAARHVDVTYRASGIGDATTPGGLIPLVTVQLRGLRHDYLMVSGMPGFGDGYTFQPLTASRMAGGMGGS